MSTNAYGIAYHPNRYLIEERDPPDAGLDGLPLTMAVEKCRRIIAACVEAVKRATELETPRLVLAR
jgi:hypothetical protein